jgi:hypothetical protein
LLYQITIMLEITEFSSLIDLTNKFPDEATCINHLEAIRWGGNVVSPFDPTSKVYKCAGFKYRCKNTKKYFNVRTGTIFGDTKMPLQKWFMAIYIVNSHKKGISSHQLAKDLVITQKSAWFMLQRIRYAFGHENFKKTMAGQIQADEAYMGGLEKNRHKDKKKSRQGRLDDKTPVVGMLDNSGNVITQVTPMVTKRAVTDFILDNTKREPGTKLITDSHPSYNKVGRKFDDHIIVKHSAGQYMVNGFHTNGLENYWSLLKRGIYGIYHSVSPAHLHRYCHEFAFRFNTRKIRDNARFNLYLTSMNKRLTYKELIRNGE